MILRRTNWTTFSMVEPMTSVCMDTNLIWRLLVRCDGFRVKGVDVSVLLLYLDNTTNLLYYLYLVNCINNYIRCFYNDGYVLRTQSLRRSVTSVPFFLLNILRVEESQIFILFHLSVICTFLYVQWAIVFTILPLSVVDLSSSIKSQSNYLPPIKS